MQCLFDKKPKKVHKTAGMLLKTPATQHLTSFGKYMTPWGGGTLYSDL